MIPKLNSLVPEEITESISGVGDKTIVNAVLEIDHDRGVIYVHLVTEFAMKMFGNTGQTALRICQLPKPIPRRPLDITFGHGADWRCNTDFFKDEGEEKSESSDKE